MSSIYKHSWYLDPKLIPLALADDDVPDVEGEKIAEAILQNPMPQEDVKDYEISGQRQDVEEVLCFKSSDVNPPSIAPLVDSSSYFLFASLGLDEERIRDWPQLPAKHWSRQSTFNKFKDFCLQLTVVNDPAERAVGK